MRAFLALDAGQERKPFCRDLRIRQDVFDRCDFRFGEKERVWRPVQQSFVKQLLRSNARTEDPKTFWNFSGDSRNQKGLGRFGNVGKRDRTHPFRDLAYFLRDRFRARGDGGKVIAGRFFHRACSPEPGELQTAYIRRPTASATARKRGTRSAKTSGKIACSPSLLANCGESCTSIMTASAPAATAASAICGTKSRRPIPWVGSTTTGRCVFDFRMGTALR